MLTLTVHIMNHMPYMTALSSSCLSWWRPHSPDCLWQYTWTTQWLPNGFSSIAPSVDPANSQLACCALVVCVGVCSPIHTYTNGVLV